MEDRLTKITSKTLYRQWRNLTSLYPHRCDPNWIDFNVSNTLTPAMMEYIKKQQAEHYSDIPRGYAWFIEDMHELLRTPEEVALPKVGAPFLSLKYQDVEAPYDYCIVPLMSAVCGPYRSSSENNKVLASNGRFTVSSLWRSGAIQKSGVSKKSRKNWQESDREDFKYDQEVPLPTEPPKHFRRIASAELEWIDLMMLANYQFNKHTVQLLYMPIESPYTDAWMFPFKITAGRERDYLDDATLRETAVKKRSQSRLEKLASKSGFERLHSAPVTITANTLLSGQTDKEIEWLQKIDIKTIMPERVTDLVTGRRLFEDGVELDDDDDDVLDPYANFIFAPDIPLMLRDEDPNHESRKGDYNKGYLFLEDEWRSLATNWYVHMFDPVAGHMVNKTLDQWRIECELDGIPVMPMKWIPGLLERGLIVDNILYLSTMITENTPDDQVEKIVQEFIDEEARLNEQP